MYVRVLLFQSASQPVFADIFNSDADAIIDAFATTNASGQSTAASAIQQQQQQQPQQQQQHALPGENDRKR